MVALAAGLLILPVLLAAWGPLYNETDGQYASAARTMALGGSWLVPENNGVPRLVKPPLLTWLIAGAMKIFGPGEFAARLPGALAISVTGLAIYGIGVIWGSHRRGLLAAGIWLSILGNFTLGRIVMPEPVFTANIVLAVCSFLVAVRHKGTSRKVAVLALWTFGALAAFVKGPHGLLLPLLGVAAALMSYRMARGERALSFQELFPVAGFAAALAINLPWHLSMETRFPGYLHNLLISEYLGHVLGSDAPATGRGNVPTGLFVALHLAWFFPWSAALAGTRVEGLKGISSPSRWSLAGWTILWMAVVTGIPVLLTGQRQDYYAMSAWPFVALLLARILENARWNRSRLAVSLCLMAAVGACAVAALNTPPAPSLSLQERSTALSTVLSLDREIWMRLLGVAVAGCGAGIVALLLVRPCWLSLVIAGACLGISACAGTALVSPLFSAKSWASIARTLAGEEGQIVFCGDVDSASSLLFYSGRQIFLLGVEPQRDFVIRTTGQGRKNYLSESEFVEAWHSTRAVVLVCDESEIPAWEEKLGQKLKVEAAAGTTRVLANKAEQKIIPTE